MTDSRESGSDRRGALGRDQGDGSGRGEAGELERLGELVGHSPTIGALRRRAKRGMLARARSRRRKPMPTQIGENRAKKMLKGNELVLVMGVNQLRSPNIAMISAA